MESFLDDHETAEFIRRMENKVIIEETSALRCTEGKQGKTTGKQTLICPDSLLVVDGALGKVETASVGGVQWANESHGPVGGNPVPADNPWPQSPLATCGCPPTLAFKETTKHACWMLLDALQLVPMEDAPLGPRSLK